MHRTSQALEYNLKTVIFYMLYQHTFVSFKITCMLHHVFLSLFLSFHLESPVHSWYYVPHTRTQQSIETDDRSYFFFYHPLQYLFPDTAVMSEVVVHVNPLKVWQ